MLKELLSRPDSPWTSPDGPDRDVAMSSRIRLARNFRDYPFPHKASHSEAMHVWKHAADFADECDDLGFYDYRQEAGEDLKVLVEKHLISPQHALQKERHPALVLSEDFKLSIMVHEEDHLRIQAFSSGFDFIPAYERAQMAAAELGRKAPYAYSPRWGYLTACPTNIGTGLRVSVLLHLPGLIHRQGPDVLKSLTPMGLTARGLYGEGSKAYGDFYQISNQRTLGYRARDIIELLQSVCKHIIHEERRARQAIKDQGLAFEDHVFRSYGLLANARHMDLEEAFRRLSSLRLGLAEGLFSGHEPQEIDPLYVAIQSASIQKSAGQPLEDADLGRIRAERLRHAMAELSSS